MALITAPAADNADAYGSLDYFKAYCTTVGHDVGSMPDDKLEQAIRRGTRYIDAAYGERFIGEPATVEQSLEWPRKEAVYRGKLLPDDVIPLKVVSASFEAAFLEASQPGILSGDFNPTERIIREKVGDLETQYADVQNMTADQAAPVFGVIEGLLFGLIAPDASKRSGAVFGHVGRG